MIWQTIITFVSMLALDFVWAQYAIACSEKRPFGAAVWAFLIAILGGMAIIIYADNHWMILPSALGGFCGTYLAVKLDK